MEHPVLWTIGRCRLGGAAVVLAMVVVECFCRGCSAASQEVAPAAHAASDAGFVLAMEDWVAGASGPHRMVDALGPADAGLIGRLGSPRFAEREAARRALARRGAVADVGGAVAGPGDPVACCGPARQARTRGGGRALIDPRKQRFAIYARAIADLMGLRDWTIGVDDEPPAPDRLAEIECRYGRKIAWIRLSEEFLGSPPERQRQTVVHELTHCHFEPMRRLLLDLLEDRIWTAVEIPFEYGVDAVAEELAKHLPLPDGVRPVKRKA